MCGQTSCLPKDHRSQERKRFLGIDRLPQPIIDAGSASPSIASCQAWRHGLMSCSTVSGRTLLPTRWLGPEPRSPSMLLWRSVCHLALLAIQWQATRPADSAIDRGIRRGGSTPFGSLRSNSLPCYRTTVQLVICRMGAGGLLPCGVPRPGWIIEGVPLLGPDSGELSGELGGGLRASDGLQVQSAAELARSAAGLGSAARLGAPTGLACASCRLAALGR